MGQLRHGGYLLNEFRDREAEIDVSSGKSYYFRKEELGRGRARYRRRTNDLEGGRDGSIRVRVGQLDVQEQEMVNGKFLSSPNMSYPVDEDDRRRKQNGRAIREVDREPGELSSGSGTDESDVFDSRSMDNQGLSSKDAARLVPGRKRKFSCVAWNVEDRQVNISSVNNNGIPDSIFPSPCHSSDETRASMSEQNSLSNSECSPLCPGTAPGSMRFIAVEPLAGSSSASPSQREQDKVQDKGQSVEGNHDFSRKLSASRWANEHCFPRNEGEISEDESESTRKKPVILVEAVWSRLNSKEKYPELGELTAEDSERARSRTSGFSGDGNQSHLASEDEVQLNGNGCMELDEEEGSENACAHQSELDSLPVDDSNGAASSRSFNMLHGCRSVNDFEKLNKINEGTYGIVFRARDKKSGEVVALKKVKMEKEREGFPLTSLREINILLSCSHPSIVDLKEVVIGRDINQVFMVMEYMEHDLKGLMDAVEQPFSQSEVKCLMLQLLEGVHYLHDNWIIHRDLKTSNLLLNNRGELKICDFGLARQYGSPLKPYTQLVVTLWYRAPELLLGAKKYSTAVDMWSLGCIMAELLAKEPLFSGKSEIDQLDKIFKTLGTPTKNIWPGFTMLPGARVKYTKQPYNNLLKKFPRASFTGRSVLSEAGFDLLNRLLTYDPEKRITAEDALNHEWFREVPLPKSIDFMPAIPAQYAQDRRP